MNTVLDDNKKLCLNSGQIIKLKPTMTIMFEVGDLAVASPATVSRCGMVLTEPVELGYTNLIESYVSEISPIFVKQANNLLKMFNYFLDVTVIWSWKFGMFPVPSSTLFLTKAVLNIFNAFIFKYRKEYLQYVEDDPERFKLPKEIDEMIPNYLLFSIIWGIGGSMHESKRPQFNDMLYEIIAGENIYQKCKLDMRIPLKEGQEFEIMKLNVNVPADVKNLFDIYYDDNKLAWINWVKTIPQYMIPKNEEYQNIIVPTADSIRLAKMMEMLIVSEKHVLFCGPTGTGKTISINKQLNEGFDENYTSFSISFSAQTTANQT